MTIGERGPPVLPAAVVVGNGKPFSVSDRRSRCVTMIRSLGSSFVRIVGIGGLGNVRCDQFI